MAYLSIVGMVARKDWQGQGGIKGIEASHTD